MFSGWSFGIPAEIVSFLMILVGTPVAILLWILAFASSTKEFSAKKILCCLLLTVAVVAHVGYFVIRGVIPQPWTANSFLGVPAISVVYLLLWVIGVACSVICFIISRGYKGGIGLLIRLGSVIFMAINALGFVLFILGLPGMPFG